MTNMSPSLIVTWKVPLKRGRGRRVAALLGVFRTQAWVVCFDPIKTKGNKDHESCVSVFFFSNFRWPVS